MKIADLDTNNEGECPKEWQRLMVNGINYFKPQVMQLHFSLSME